jgi:uncharacterized protein (TIGR00730 family)
MSQDPAPSPDLDPHDEAATLLHRDFTAGYADERPHPAEHLVSRKHDFAKRIESLVRDWGCDNGHQDYIAELITTALQIGHDDCTSLDLKIMNRVMKEMRKANNVFAPYRYRRKVTVFGSARTAAGDPEYEAAKQFCQRMVERGFMVITGAGPGIMAAGNEGAGAGESFGLRISLPFEAGANQWIENDPKLVNFKYFFIRKLSFVKEADAVALFPGGFGTMDEGFETMTLIQTGKATLFPIVMIDAPGGTYWKTFLQFIKEHLLRRKMISPEDLHLFKVTDNTEAAAQEILQFYRIFHSYRFVRDKLVIRLNHSITPASLERINELHSFILQHGQFTLGQAFAEEKTEPELEVLPRLIGTPKRSHYGRLRQMIDTLNQAEIREQV